MLPMRISDSLKCLSLMKLLKQITRKKLRKIYFQNDSHPRAKSLCRYGYRKRYIYIYIKQKRISNYYFMLILRCSCLTQSFSQLNLYIYTSLPVNAIVRLPHTRSGDSQGQETFPAPSADKQTCNYDTECSNHHPSPSTLRSKGLSCSKMKWWAIYTIMYTPDCQI